MFEGVVGVYLLFFVVEILEHGVEAVLRGHDVHFCESAQAFLKGSDGYGLCAVCHFESLARKGYVVVAEVYACFALLDESHLFERFNDAAHGGFAERGGVAEILLGADIALGNGYHYIPLIAVDIESG